MATLALDVYGTLIDPLAVTTELAAHAGERAALFSQTWRDKQLEYSFRRGLMGKAAYRDFAVCTRQALDYTCLKLDVELGDDIRSALLARYRELPAFPDVPGALAELAAAGHRLYAFSNGLPDDLAALLGHAGLDRLLAGTVSVHDVQSFKPDPAVYRHFVASAGADADAPWLVSSNPFDIIGARAQGWRAAWVRRAATALFDPWEFEPSVIISSLAELPAQLAATH